jgi:predicted amidohydrolase
MIMSNSVIHKSIFAGFLQFDVKSGNISHNLSRVENGLAEIAASNSQSPGMIVLPELWATGFAYEKLPKLSKKTPELLDKLLTLTAKYQIYIVGSLPEYSEQSFYNTLFITGPEGIAGTYRKQRLFNPMQEDDFFTPGEKPCSIETVLGPVGALVCYDLRFPELSRKQTSTETKLLVVSAQWPAVRIDNWRILVQARAIENQIFVIAANRCGTTDDTIFGGHSMIVGPDGSILLEAEEDEKCSGIILDLESVSAARSLFSTIPNK